MTENECIQYLLDNTELDTDTIIRVLSLLKERNVLTLSKADAITVLHTLKEKL